VTGGGKGSERRGPWHHAAVAALQGASIEEQLQYLDPDIVQGEELHQSVDGPGLGFGSLHKDDEAWTRGLVAAPNARSEVSSASDDRAAQLAGMRIWSRWDVHARGKIVRR